MLEPPGPPSPLCLLSGAFLGGEVPVESPGPPPSGAPEAETVGIWLRELSFNSHSAKCGC